MAQSLAPGAASYELVHSEVEKTISEAERSLEQFQENRESSEDLQNCVDYLNQLRGIFVLVQLQGGILLCQEAVSLANEVPVGATDDKNNLLTTLNNALYVLRRYIEYFRHVGEDHPVLLLPMINELRQARNDKTLPDSHFFDFDLSRRVDCTEPFRNETFFPREDFDHHARRYRQMYQIALLGFIRERNLKVSFKLLGKSAEGFSRLCGEAPLRQLWCLLHLVALAMEERNMEMTTSRKRLFMRIERYAKEVVYLKQVATAKNAPDSIRRELIYLLAISGSKHKHVNWLLQQYGIEPLAFNDQIRMRHRKLLFGPGVDALTALRDAIAEEVTLLKDKLDIFERGIDPDVADYSAIRESFRKLGSVMKMLELDKFRELIGKQMEILDNWGEKGTSPTEDDLLGMADCVIALEHACQMLVSAGISKEVDDLADIGLCGRKDENLFLTEAMRLIIDETKEAITQTKRAITAFIESDFDKESLGEIHQTLENVSGCMKIIAQNRFAASIDATNRAIQSELANSASVPDQRILETIADVLTSLEFFIDDLAKQEKPNEELLKLSEESLKSIDYVVS